MEPLDVPEVRQLPELTGGDENPVALVDMVLTSLLGYDCALLYAEFSSADGADTSVGWRIEPREPGIYARDIEIAISPSRGSFRSALARFGAHYMGGQLYNGYALRFLRQRERIHRTFIYMSNMSQTGFWIRVYAARCDFPRQSQP
jgi:hypothetical protein